jgi:hypothetical protein
MNRVVSGSRSLGLLRQVVGSMLEMKRHGDAGVGVRLERLVDHHGTQVGAADADVDDGLDPLAGDPDPLAGAHLVGEGVDAVEHLVHVLVDVLAVDDQLARLVLDRAAQRGVQHGAVLGVVDALTGIHRGAPPDEIDLLTQLHQGREHVIGRRDSWTGRRAGQRRSASAAPPARGRPRTSHAGPAASRPDLVVGTSIGALNGALLATEPGPRRHRPAGGTCGARPRPRPARSTATAPVTQVRRAVRSRTPCLLAAAAARAPRAGARRGLDSRTFAVHFQCVRVEHRARAAEHWFTRGPVAPAVMASAAVPGFFPPAQIDGEHFLDGGIVNSVPVGHGPSSSARPRRLRPPGRPRRPPPSRHRATRSTSRGCPSRSPAGTVSTGR